MNKNTASEARIPEAGGSLSSLLIDSGAWVLPLVLAVFAVYREFRKETARGLRALGALLVVGSTLILLPEFGMVLLGLAALALVIGVIGSYH